MKNNTTLAKNAVFPIVGIGASAGGGITDIVTDLLYPEMAADAQEVLRTLVYRDVEVPTAEGLWYKVRTMPFRTQENHIDGEVITFSDISVSKKLQAELRATQARLQAMMSSTQPSSGGA